jgi:hypothetical protein
MPRRGYSNVAYPIYLVGSLDGSSTSNVISVSTDPNGVATAPPGWPATKPYYAVIDPDTPNEEVVSVTASSGSTLTITRGTALGASGYGTTTKSHQNGAMIAHVATAADHDENNAHVNASTQVHGLAASSAVVGTTDTQTLTNKTLNSSTIGASTSINAAATLSAGGTIVGTSATQTLTNKTLTSPVLTTPTLSGGGAIVDVSSTQTLTNKSLTSPTITGTGAIAAASLTTTGAVTATGAVVGSNLPSGLDLSSMFTPLSYTPAVTGSTTDPGLGTSPTVEGRYILMGKLVYVHIRIIVGTSPTPGSGSYSISLPVAAASTNGVVPGVFHAGTTANRVPVAGVLLGSVITRVDLPMWVTGPTYGGTWASGGPWAIGSGGTPSLVAGDVVMFDGVYLR